MGAFMLTRRELVHRALLAGAGSAVGSAHSQDKSTLSLRLLILGGTGHIGPHYVRAALQRGHCVAIFSRGRTSADLPQGVEILTGDRNGNLESIRGRDWDAVLDLATFGPSWVHTLGKAMQRRIRHYTFISTISVYDAPANNRGGTREGAPVLGYKDAVDPYSITGISPQYGALKALCEREAHRQFAGRVLIVRPGAIVGPGDSIGAFTYWAVRMRKGGEVLAAGSASSPVQVIDVRDLAMWTIHMVEQGITGVFNAVGPARPLTWGGMLNALIAPSPEAPRLTWVPVQWLQERHAPLQGNWLFWPSEAGVPGVMRMRNDKAVAQGLTFRLFSSTVADTLGWYDAQPADRQTRLLMGTHGTRALEDSMAEERQLLLQWHREAQKSSSATTKQALPTDRTRSRDGA